MFSRTSIALWSLALTGLFLASAYAPAEAARRQRTTTTRTTRTTRATLTTPITLTVPSPAAGTVPITAQKSLARLESLAILRDGVKLLSCKSSPCTVSWDTLQSINGSHVVAAQHLDRRNRVLASTSVTVTVNNDLTPPYVTLNAPSTATGSVTLSASASDTSGVAALTIAVDGVQLNAPGATVNAMATTAPGTASTDVTWDASTATSGTHTVQAFATDSSGNVGSSEPVTVMVTTGTIDPTPIPELALWESHMLTYGQKYCDYLDREDVTFAYKLDSTYYDQVLVFYQIADYTGDPNWNACAAKAKAVYRDGYVLPNNGGVPGYWNFPTGLRMDYQRTEDSVSKNTAILLSHNAAYARDSTPLTWTETANLSREVAYAILSYLNAEMLGEAPRTRRAQLVDQAYGHLDQWFVSFTWMPPDNTVDRIAPFMVGLTAHTLIRDWEQTHDSRLISALKLAADWLWDNAWIPDKQSMWYANNNQTPAPDLNMLIAPMYAFLYRQTGEVKYRDQGDQLFAGGAKLAYLGSGKHFDQNYFWSFHYVQWRSGR